MKILWLLLFIPLFTNCGSSNDSSRPLSLLQSPARASAWGSPTKVNTANGYRLTYTNPSNSRESVMIEGSHNLFPSFFYPPHVKGRSGAAAAQVWRYAEIEGKKVRWYQAAAANDTFGDQFRVVGFDLTDRQGGSGNYRILTQGPENKVRGWISELRLRP